MIPSALATACVGLLCGQEAELSPQATRVEPKTAKPGMVLTITGVALGTTEVAEVYLTDHRFDLKVKVLEQTDLKLKIRVPPFVKAGRQQVLFLTKGVKPTYLEQPVYVLVEIEEEVAKTESAPAAPGPDKPSGNNHPDKQE